MDDATEEYSEESDVQPVLVKKEDNDEPVEDRWIRLALRFWTHELVDRKLAPEFADVRVEGASQDWTISFVRYDMLFADDIERSIGNIVDLLGPHRVSLGACEYTHHFIPTTTVEVVLYTFHVTLLQQEIKPSFRRTVARMWKDFRPYICGASVMFFVLVAGIVVLAIVLEHGHRSSRNRMYRVN